MILAKRQLVKQQLVKQQECALSHASHLYAMASQYGQMGFTEIARFCQTQAGNAVRYAANIFLRKF